MFNFPLLIKEIWRTGQLKLFSLTLLFVVGSFAASDQIFHLMEQSLTEKVSTLMGADRTVVSWRNIPQKWVDETDTNKLKHSLVTSLGSMVASEQGFQLASIAAIDKFYPLAGHIVIAQNRKDTVGQVQQSPSPGNIWLSLRLADALEVKVGQKVNLGKIQLTVTGLILDEPGNVGGMAGLAPRAIINLDDLPSTALVRPGSRVQFKLLLAGDEENLSIYHRWLKDKLKPGEQWQDPAQSTSSSKLLSRIRTFLAVSTMIALLLGIAALAFSGYRFAEEQRERVALWRCLGIKRSQLIRQYLKLMLVIGLLGGLLGILLGTLFSQFMLMMFSDFVGTGMPIFSAQSFNVSSAVLSIATGLLLVSVFLFPTLYQATAIPPLAILRPQQGHLKIPFHYWVPGVLSVMLIAFYWSEDWKLWAAFMLGIITLTIVLVLLTGLFTRVFSSLALTRGGSLAIVSQMIKTNRKSISLQMLVTSMILSLFGLIFLVSQGLFQQWQQELPEDTPNLFLFNVAPEDKSLIDADLKQLKLQSSNWYPIARGRLVKLNNQPILQAVTEKQKQDNALKRELNLTFSNKLEADNEIIAGNWPPSQLHNSSGKTINTLSVEQGLANRLDLHLGDELTFAVGAEQLMGKISSIRKVHWDSFKPNFFIIFPSESKQDIAVTFLSSFYVPAGGLKAVEKTLKQYPSVSMIPVDRVLSQLRSLISQAGIILQLSMGFIALLAFILILTVLHITFRQRLLQGLVIRAVGGSNRLIHRLLLMEWWTLGIISGLVAAIFVELGYAWVAVGLLDLKEQLHPLIWVVLPVIASLVLMLSGQGLRKRLTQQSPLLLLKEQLG